MAGGGLSPLSSHLYANVVNRDVATVIRRVGAELDFPRALADGAVAADGL